MKNDELDSGLSALDTFSSGCSGFNDEGTINFDPVSRANWLIHGAGLAEDSHTGRGKVDLRKPRQYP